MKEASRRAHQETTLTDPVTPPCIFGVDAGIIIPRICGSIRGSYLARKMPKAPLRAPPETPVPVPKAPGLAPGVRIVHPTVCCVLAVQNGVSAASGEPPLQGGPSRAHFGHSSWSRSMSSHSRPKSSHFVSTLLEKKKTRQKRDNTVSNGDSPSSRHEKEC